MINKIKDIKLARLTDEDRYVLNILSDLEIDENRTETNKTIAYKNNGKTVFLIDIDDKVLLVSLDVFNDILKILTDKEGRLYFGDEVFEIIDRNIQEYLGWDNYNKKRILTHEFKRKFNTED